MHSDGVPESVLRSPSLLNFDSGWILADLETTEFSSNRASPDSGVKRSNLTESTRPARPVVVVGRLGNLPGSFTVSSPNLEVLKPVLDIDGVLWVEPVLVTHARNEQLQRSCRTACLTTTPTGRWD